MGSLCDDAVFLMRSKSQLAAILKIDRYRGTLAITRFFYLSLPYKFSSLKHIYWCLNCAETWFDGGTLTRLTSIKENYNFFFFVPDLSIYFLKFLILAQYY